MNAVLHESAPTDPVGAGRELISATDLTIAFATDDGYADVLKGVSLSIEAGDSVGLVGESGSGKSVTCKAMLGVVEPGGRVVSGEVRWEGEPLLGPQGPKNLRRVRGRRMATIPQDPMTALDPVFTVGYQIREVCRFVRGMGRKQSRDRAIELLNLVGVSSPEQRLGQYPHEFSGGMQQRVLIAMALAAEPDLIIADEPTTALDVTVQGQILELLRTLRTELDLAVLLVTHDLGVVAEVCDRVLVMYAGRIVEEGTADQIFNRPKHPYTQGLLASSPRVDLAPGERLEGIPGTPPSPYRPVAGCAFRPRCPKATAECATVPELVPLGSGRVACWNARSE